MEHIPGGSRAGITESIISKRAIKVLRPLVGRLSLSVGWGNSPEMTFCCRPDQTPCYAMVDLGCHWFASAQVQILIFTQRSVVQRRRLALLQITGTWILYMVSDMHVDNSRRLHAELVILLCNVL